MYAAVELIDEPATSCHSKRTEAMLRQTYASVTEYAELAQKLPDDVYAAMLYCAMRAVGMNPTPFESFDWANHTVYTG